MTNLARFVVSAVAGTATRILDAYRRGGRTTTLAPALLVFAIVPEAIQHVAEIHLGMFGSLSAFRAHATDPVRMVPGVIKVIGFLFAILAVAKFWDTGSVTRAMRMQGRDLVRVLLVLAVTVATSLPFLLVPPGSAFAMPATAFSALIQSGLLVWLVAALLGDREVTLRASFTSRWPTAAVLTVVAAAAFAPCQALHQLDHRLAIGAPVPLVWLLMAWDALFVGLFAALVGSALWVGYRRGATWRGWLVDGHVRAPAAAGPPSGASRV